MSARSFDFRNVNTLWGSVMVETLFRCGVRQAVISPGSRSTPLTVTLTRNPQIESIPVLDERSAAFFALGLARQSGSPVVLICTSGTAGANYYPAVIEAQESGVQLVVITADRPPELRACASGQTIDQQQLYGVHVNYFHELSLPGVSLEMLAYLRQTVAHAVDRSTLPQRGPVHINAPFRDPLDPAEDPAVMQLADEIPRDFFDHLDGPHRSTSSQTKIWQRAITARGLIVAGPECPDDPASYAKSVAQLSAQLGWPILADGVSPLRHFQTSRAVVVTAYDTILRSASLARDLVPRHVLCLGSWPTSKVLRQWIEQSGAEIVLVSERHDNRDALHGRTRQIHAPVEALVTKAKSKITQDYAKLWRVVEQRARAGMTKMPRNPQLIFEGDVAATLAHSLPSDTPVYVASSMPIRDVEYFWPITKKRFRMFFNRGANGIDGTLSSALGTAHGNQPAVLLTGDLAFLHDSNGLLLHSKLRGSLTVVLINNDGGGIFEHLPIAQHEPPFEEYFATPQMVDFEQLCAAHGVKYTLVQSLDRLAKMTSRLPVSGIQVLELRTNRELDAAFRKRMFTRCAAAL